MKKKTLSRVFAGALAVAMAVGALSVAQPVMAAKEAVTGSAEKISRVTVHDPSIVRDPDTGTYYVFGSHLATAKSDDLVNWTQISTDYQDADNNPVYGNVVENFAESFEWAGYDDGDCAGGNLAVWAPDVFWDDAYVWDDGSKGAWLMYYSASSTWRRSCIGLAVSRTIEGPYSYVDTLVYSGMTTTGAVDGNSERNTKWDNDYLNFKELIEKGVKNGGITGISQKWFTESGDYNTDYAPNAIDPAIIRDTDGEMYMVYGSWSGGLYLLGLDEATGLAEYPGTDGVDGVSGNYVDRYYGIHLAGGNHGGNVESGEGPYLVYDKEAGYYYLYETYGGLTRTGGYNMRVFRSKCIQGPYVDAAGQLASNNNLDHTKYGVKLIGNYQFYNQRGYCAAGHNSVLIDTDGSRYLVSHQRFNEGTEYHEVRVRQQFLNADGWPVTAVYENRNEKIKSYSKKSVVGNYEFVNHGTDNSGAMIETQNITLNADGTVTGDVTGTWARTVSKKRGYDYITLKVGDVTYKGVFFQQTNDAGKKTMTFSAIGDNNASVWGSKLSVSDKTMAKVIASRISLPSTTRVDVTLPTDLGGATITWSSSNKGLISTKGVVGTAEEDTSVLLKATVKYGKSTYVKRYRVTVLGKPTLIYGFDFSSVDGTAVAPTSGSAKTASATLTGGASVVKDDVRGDVLSVTNEAGAKNVNYLRLPEDTLADVTASGYTVSMWVNISADTFEHSALFEADAKNAYPLTRIGVNLIGRINANGYSDSVQFRSDRRDVWQMVTYTVNANGINVYLDGELAGSEVKDIASCFDASNPACIQHATDVMVGSGAIWNDEDIRSGRFDNVEVYNGAMTAAEVLALYNATK